MSGHKISRAEIEGYSKETLESNIQYLVRELILGDQEYYSSLRPWRTTMLALHREIYEKKYADPTGVQAPDDVDQLHAEEPAGPGPE